MSQDKSEFLRNTNPDDSLKDSSPENPCPITDQRGSALEKKGKVGANLQPSQNPDATPLENKPKPIRNKHDVNKVDEIKPKRIKVQSEASENEDFIKESEINLSEEQAECLAAEAKRSVIKMLREETWTTKAETCGHREFEEGQGHYKQGFCAKIMCRILPIPSHAKRKDEATGKSTMTPTGQSGSVEQTWVGKSERVRGVETVKEFVKRGEFKTNETGSVAATSRMTCKSPLVCFTCSVKRQVEALNFIIWLVMRGVLAGWSYFFMTVAFPHFYGNDKKSLDLLRDTWSKALEHRRYVELAKKYGVRFLIKTIEITFDNLFYDYEANGVKRSGMHPHFHVIMLAPHDITPEKLEEFRKEMTKVLIYIIRQNDLVDREELEKKIKYMMKHTVNVKLYGDFTDETLAATEEAWENETFEMPEQFKGFKSIYDRNWRDRPDHFIKQLAGIDGMAGYLAANTPETQNSSLAKEVTLGRNKKGRESRRVSLHEFLYQCSISENPEDRKHAIEVCEMLVGVPFCVFPRGYKKEIEAEYRPSVYNHETGKVEYAVTENEWEEEKIAREERDVPIDIRGDRMMLAFYPMADHRWHSILVHGEAKFNKELNGLILKETELAGRKLTHEEIKKIYEKFLNEVMEKVSLAAVEEDISYIPDHYMESRCWDFVPEIAVSRESRSSIERAKMIKRANKKAFKELCALVYEQCKEYELDLYDELNADGVVDENLDKLESYATFDMLGVSDVIDKYWADKGKELVLNEREMYIKLASIRKEAIVEDNLEYIERFFGPAENRKLFKIYDGVMPCLNGISVILDYYEKNVYKKDFYANHKMEKCCIERTVDSLTGKKEIIEFDANILGDYYNGAIDRRAAQLEEMQEKWDEAIQKIYSFMYLVSLVIETEFNLSLNQSSLIDSPVRVPKDKALCKPIFEWLKPQHKGLLVCDVNVELEPLAPFSGVIQGVKSFNSRNATCWNRWYLRYRERVTLIRDKNNGIFGKSA